MWCIVTPIQLQKVRTPTLGLYFQSMALGELIELSQLKTEFLSMSATLITDQDLIQKLYNNYTINA